MADERDPEKQTQQEVRQQAAHEGDDPQTAREETELDLMEEGASDEGEVIGDPLD
ncbi:MAG: hypothetical protein QOG03_2444 [Actinomycetota bacterium]|nr:hypothetical protein [Actinomycetota bacterium]